MTACAYGRPGRDVGGDDEVGGDDDVGGEVDVAPGAVVVVEDVEEVVDDEVVDDEVVDDEVVDDVGRPGAKIVVVAEAGAVVIGDPGPEVGLLIVGSLVPSVPVVVVTPPDGRRTADRRPEVR